MFFVAGDEVGEGIVVEVLITKECDDGGEGRLRRFDYVWFALLIAVDASNAISHDKARATRCKTEKRVSNGASSSVWTTILL
jgi:hypothetical protein